MLLSSWISVIGQYFVYWGEAWPIIDSSQRMSVCQHVEAVLVSEGRQNESKDVLYSG